MFRKNKQFTESYSVYYPVVYNAIYAKVSSADDAEDISQEVFIKYYNKLDEIENSRKWLLGTLRLEVMNYYRKKKDNHVDIDTLFQDINLAYVNGFKDTRIMINDAIEDMGNFQDDKEKSLFELIAIRNYTYEEAGIELGFTKRQVRYRYENIVSRIVDYFKKSGITNLEELL